MKPTPLRLLLVVVALLLAGLATADAKSLAPDIEEPMIVDYDPVPPKPRPLWRGFGWWLRWLFPVEP